jgi:hypothetical protein
VSQYLLSTYRVSGEVPRKPSSPGEMEAFMKKVIDLEDEMDASGAFVFGGALREPTQSTVVGVGDMIVTDGPFAEAKEQIAGFYIINADDDDEARSWAHRVADATNHPIEVRPFAATGRAKDHRERG